jgi:nucleoside 2-deoxyribosyltransferase
MTTDNEKQCPVCRLVEQDVVREADYGERITYNCARCGRFTITRTAERKTENMEMSSKLSAWIRERNEWGIDVPEINSKSLQEIVQSIPDYNPSDKQLLLLRAIARKSKYPGDSISLLPRFDYPLAWASAEEEFFYYIRSLINRGLLAWTKEGPLAFGDMAIEVEVSADGWDYLDQSAQRSAEFRQVFVAMSFSESMKPIWAEAIKPAIVEAGYKPYRIDVESHIDRIDAKIIAEIKNSLFVVADVTEQKHGVYFEAGYALGRKIPVIWCVRKNDLSSIHFDTRQYNHIVWDSPEKLREKLYDTICAVIGKRTDDKVAR